MIRRSSRGLNQRLALSLTALLIVGSLALPALADGPKTFTADISSSDTPPNVEERGIFAISIALNNESSGGSGLTIGSANVTPPGDVTFDPVDPRVNRGVLELRDLYLPPGEGRTFEVSASASCDAGPYNFRVVAKQSNAFRGSGNDIALIGEGHLDVELNCKEPDLEQEEPLCAGIDEDCVGLEFDPERIPDAKSQTITLDAPNRVDARIFGGYRTNELAELVSDACEDLLGDNDRLARDVIEIRPVDFNDGDEITVTYVIPRAYVNEETNRGAGNFQVCFAPDKASVGSLAGLNEFYSSPDPDRDFALYGPELLLPCSAEHGAPCIVSRTKERADVVIVFRIPAQDPWMR